MAINVRVNLPTEENYNEFQDRMCFAVAKVVLETQSPKYIKRLISHLKEVSIIK